MPWDEFLTLLGGIMPKTPLGQVVSIRMEDDKDVLKHFTRQQHVIRNAWRSRRAQAMTEEEKEDAIEKLEKAFGRAFGG